MDRQTLLSQLHWLHEDIDTSTWTLDEIKAVIALYRYWSGGGKSGTSENCTSREAVHQEVAPQGSAHLESSFAGTSGSVQSTSENGPSSASVPQLHPPHQIYDDSQEVPTQYSAPPEVAPQDSSHLESSIAGTSGSVQSTSENGPSSASVPQLHPPHQIYDDSQEVPTQYSAPPEVAPQDSSHLESSITGTSGSVQSTSENGPSSASVPQLHPPHQIYDDSQEVPTQYSAPPEVAPQDSSHLESSIAGTSGSVQSTLENGPSSILQPCSSHWNYNDPQKALFVNSAPQDVEDDQLLKSYENKLTTNSGLTNLLRNETKKRRNRFKRRQKKKRLNDIDLEPSNIPLQDEPNEYDCTAPNDEISSIVLHNINEITVLNEEREQNGIKQYNFDSLMPNILQNEHNTNRGDENNAVSEIEENTTTLSSLLLDDEKISTNTTLSKETMSDSVCYFASGVIETVNCNEVLKHQENKLSGNSELTILPNETKKRRNRFKRRQKKKRLNDIDLEPSNIPLQDEPNEYDCTAPNDEISSIVLHNINEITVLNEKREQNGIKQYNFDSSMPNILQTEHKDTNKGHENNAVSEIEENTTTLSSRLLDDEKISDQKDISNINTNDENSSLTSTTLSKETMSHSVCYSASGVIETVNDNEVLKHQENKLTGNSGLSDMLRNEDFAENTSNSNFTLNNRRYQSRASRIIKVLSQTALRLCCCVGSPSPDMNDMDDNIDFAANIVQDLVATSLDITEKRKSFENISIQKESTSSPIDDASEETDMGNPNDIEKHKHIINSDIAGKKRFVKNNTPLLRRVIMSLSACFSKG